MFMVNDRRNIKIALFVAICFLLAGCGTNAAGPEAADETRATDETQATDGWGETQSLAVATEWAGVDFTAPAESFTLDDGTGIVLTTYRYRKGIVEALYQGDTYTITLRRSDTLKGPALADDSHTYTQEWDDTINEINVHCLGDGVHANCVYYDHDGDHFSITAHIGDEDRGLGAEELATFL